MGCPGKHSQFLVQRRSQETDLGRDRLGWSFPPSHQPLGVTVAAIYCSGSPHTPGPHQNTLSKKAGCHLPAGVLDSGALGAYATRHQRHSCSLLMERWSSLGLNSNPSGPVPPALNKSGPTLLWIPLFGGWLVRLLGF